MTKDDVDDDDEEHVVDPGAWKPVTDESIKARRRVHVRRGGAAPEPEPAVEANATGASAAPSSNPFAGISLAAPTNASAAPSETSGFGALAAPAVEAKEDAKQTTESEDKVEEASKDAPAGLSTPGGFGAIASGNNPFAALSSGSKPFGSGFSFGSSPASGFGALGAAGSTFGSTPEGGSTPGFGSGGFNFGTGAFPAIVATPLTAATGGKGSKAGGDGEGGAEEGGEGGEEGEGVQLFGNAVIKPVVSLPEQEARTGEEEEKVLFTADGSLYEFDSVTGRWRERGKGEFKVNASDKGEPSVQHARMVMRQNGNLRLLLNAAVYPGMPVQFMTGNVGVTFGVVNAAAPHDAKEGEGKEMDKAPEDAAATAPKEGGPKPKTWALRIKSADQVQALHTLLQQLRQPPGSAAEGAV